MRFRRWCLGAVLVCVVAPGAGEAQTWKVDVPVRVGASGVLRGNPLVGFGVGVSPSVESGEVRIRIDYSLFPHPLAFDEVDHFYAVPTGRLGLDRALSIRHSPKGKRSFLGVKADQWFYESGVGERRMETIGTEVGEVTPRLRVVYLDSWVGLGAVWHPSWPEEVEATAGLVTWRDRRSCLVRFRVDGEPLALNCDDPRFDGAFDTTGTDGLQGFLELRPSWKIGRLLVSASFVIDGFVRWGS